MAVMANNFVQLNQLQGCVESSHGIDAPDRVQRDELGIGSCAMHRVIKMHWNARKGIELPEFFAILKRLLAFFKEIFAFFEGSFARLV